MVYQKLDKLDKQILRLIAGDARIPFLEVARACNVSGAAIHQRIQKLTNLGILKGSYYVIDPDKIGYETCAYIGLNLKNPEAFDSVVEDSESTWNSGNSAPTRQKDFPPTDLFLRSSLEETFL